MPEEKSEQTSGFAQLWAQAQASWLRAFQQLSEATSNIMAGKPNTEAASNFLDSWLEAYQNTLRSLSVIPPAVPMRTSLEMMLGAADAFLKLQRGWLQSVEAAPITEMLRISAQNVETLSRAFRDMFDNMGHLQLPEPIRQLLLPFGQMGQQIMAGWSGIISNLAGPAQQLFLPWMEAWQKISTGAISALAAGESMAALGKFHDTWTSAYRDTLGKFLGMPFIGPMRVTAEKVARTADAYFKYVGACIDFAFRAYQPATASMEKVIEKAREILSHEFSPEGARELYNLSLQIFEESFQQFFKSEGFTRGLHLMLEQMLDFRKAYDDLLEAWLSQTPVVTRKEMDEVYAELYKLKKELNRQQKQLSELLGKR